MPDLPSNPPHSPTWSRPSVPESYNRVVLRRNRWAWFRRLGPAFWTVASIISLTINVILIVVLLVMGGQIFRLKSSINDQLVNGLYENFVLMDQARIKTNIEVNTSVPARFDVPFETDTEVTLTEDTMIYGAYVNIDGGVLQINQAPTRIMLPRGTRLPVHLNITVPIDQQIPVSLNVPVDIPLNQTDLHTPFVGLQEVVLPYRTMLNDSPNSWQEIFCPPDRAPSVFCGWMDE